MRAAIALNVAVSCINAGYICLISSVILHQLELDTNDAERETRRELVRIALEELRIRYKEHPEEFGDQEMQLIRDYKLWTCLVTDADRAREKAETLSEKGDFRKSLGCGHNDTLAT